MNVDLVIRNGFVCSEQGIIRGGVAVRNGIIVQIGADSGLPTANCTYDANQNLIFPGAIEPHCHLEVYVVNGGNGFDPALFQKVIRSETRTAAQGGITTVNTTTMQTAQPLMKRYREFKDHLEGHAYTDMRIYISPFTEDNLSEIPRMTEEGVSNFKFLMGYRGDGAKALGMDEAGIDSTFLYKGFEQIAKAGLPATAMVHCEDPEIFEYTQQRVMLEPEPADYNYTDAQNRARPAVAEVVDLCKAAYIARQVGCPLYMVHVSSGDSVDQLEYFQSKGFSIVAETCPHYLVFSCDDHICRGNPQWTHYAKINPAIRGRVDRERLWRGIQQGVISTIGTDHTTYRVEEKSKGSFWEIPPGTGDGMSASLSLMISEGVNKNRISIDTLRKIMSENVAKAMGLYPRKGTLRPGSDADIVLLDLNKEWTFRHSECETLHPFSLYDGMRLKGQPVATFVRGHLVAENFKIVDDAPVGKWVDNPFPAKL